VTVSEVSQGLLWCLGGGITRGGAGIALAFCLCIQATSLKGSQGLVWRFVMSPRARSAFFSTRWLPPTLIDDTRERNSAVQRKCYLVFFDTFTLQFHKFTK